ncbi:MAG: 30S ribosomal protein S2 [Candidatus Hodgkinia cicadicola]
MRTSEVNASFIDVPSLVRLGAHYGHKSSLLKSTMRPYVLGNWHGINIINTDKTATALEIGLNTVFEAICANTPALFLCNGLNYARTLARSLASTKQYCVVSEFGGIVTNWVTFNAVGIRIKRYRKVASAIKDKRLINYYNRRVAYASKPFISAPELRGQPGAIVVFCSSNTDRVVFEANRVKVPIVGLADSLSNVKGINCVVPICEGSNKISEFLCKLFASVCIKAVLVSDRARLLGLLTDISKLRLTNYSTHQALYTMCCYFKSKYFVLDDVKAAHARLVLDVKRMIATLVSLIQTAAISFNTPVRAVINLCKLRLLTTPLSILIQTRLRSFIVWLECARCLARATSRPIIDAITTSYGKFVKPNINVEKRIPQSLNVKDSHFEYYDIGYYDFNVVGTFDYFFGLSKASG